MSLTLLDNIDLQNLSVLSSDGLILSAYLPLEQANGEANRIRLKNLLSESKALLEERLEESSQVKAVMDELSSLSDQEAFSKALYPGLALLVSLETPSEVTVFPLWSTPEARVSLSAKPVLGPLIRSRGHDVVTLLCLADNGLRLFRGYLGQLEEETPNTSFPKNLAEVIQWEESAGLDGNEHYRNRTKSPGAGTQHGEGPTSRLTEEFEKRYFREIGKALSEHLRDGEKLFLAGVHEKIALFRSENSRLPILEQELNGNFEGAQSREIIELANKKLAELAKKQVLSKLNEAMNRSPELRSSENEELEKAAELGRIELLFINDSNSLESHESLALKVLQKGGQVRIVDSPGWGEHALGVFRW